MVSSFEAFCARQFLGRHITLACQLVIEEFLSRFLIPAAETHGVSNPNISCELSVGEGRNTALLSFDFRTLVDSGISSDEIMAASDDVSDMVLGNMVSDYFMAEPGLLRMTIE